MPLDQPEEYQDKEMTFMEHIDDLRKHLFRSVIVISILSVLAFFNGDIIFDKIIFGPKKPDFWTYRVLCDIAHQYNLDESFCVTQLGFEVVNLEMAGQFTQHIFISFITGLILGLPYLLWELWRFVKPALKKSERSGMQGSVIWGTLLFVIGILFGYYILTPISINFLGNYNVSPELKNMINLGSYISFVSILTLSTGLVFELPLVVLFLAKLGIISAAFMRKYRKHAFVVVLIIAGIVTPPDISSQIVMTIPIYLLYEISIFVAANVERRRKRAEAQERL